MRWVVVGLAVASLGFVWAQPRYRVEDLNGPHALAAFRWVEEQRDAALPLLRAGLQSPDPTVRARCVRQLERLQMGGPELIERLNDSDLNVRTLAARSLLSLRDFPSSAPLLARMRDPRENGQVRAYLMEGLARARNPAVGPYALELVANPQAPSGERVAAARSLGLLRLPAALPVLRAVLLGKDENPRLRRTVGLALGRLGPAGHQVLVDFLGRPEEHPMALYGAIGGLGEARVGWPGLRRLVEAEGTAPLVRAAAARSLLRAGAPPFPTEFLRATLLHCPQAEARGMAAEAIALSGQEGLYEALYEAQDQERDGRVRCALDHALRQLPDR